MIDFGEWESMTLSLCVASIPAIIGHSVYVLVMQVPEQLIMKAGKGQPLSTWFFSTSSTSLSMDHHLNSEFAPIPGVLDGLLSPVFQESAHNSTNSRLSNLIF